MIDLWLFYHSYDELESLAIKADDILARGLGGVMFCELTPDGGELVEVLYGRLVR